MDRPDYVEFMDGEYEKISAINRTKGHDYAGDDDALANFKLAAERLGMTPTQIWGVYASKHWSAIETFIKEGDVKSEPIEGRIHDIILYCFLLLGLIEEKKRSNDVAPTREEVIARSAMPSRDQLLSHEDAAGMTPVFNHPMPRSSGMSHTTPDSDPHSPEFGRKSA